MFLRLFGYLFGIGTVAAIAVAALAFWYVDSIGRDLERGEANARYDRLENMEWDVTTRVHAADGSLMGEYADEPRLFLPIEAIPDRVQAAFLSAEDKMFREHNGINFWALGKVGFAYAKGKLTGSSARLRGASTITQQVAKNLILEDSARTADRKIKEALLALRMERTLSKDKILELYLNKIFFGSFPRRTFGIASASLAYFNKPVRDLSVEEAAYLAALPKGPNNYHPYRNRERAIERRNWVISRMHANGYITADEMEAAQAKPLEVNPERAVKMAEGAGYFRQAVRKRIIEQYGSDKLLRGGLSVRTTLDLKMQAKARKALAEGLEAYDRKFGWRGAELQVQADGDWAEALAKSLQVDDLPGWTAAVVLDVDDVAATLALEPGRQADGSISPERRQIELVLEQNEWARRIVNREGERTGPKAGEVAMSDVLSPRDIVHVEQDGEGVWRLRQRPLVSGALVAMDPHTGRVKAMVGGFAFTRGDQFNRATQARRQPGSAFKPFVYAAALDNGYTPSSVVIDGPIKIDQGRALGIWEPKNYNGKYAGPQTLRRGIEKSRNLMTVRLARDMGMPLVSEYATRFGIYENKIHGLAASLGSHDTTPLRMVAAYSVLANGGLAIEPSLIDRVQDRYGRTIYRQDRRICDGCNSGDWAGQEEPRLIDTREQVLDPHTAYQITSMMEGVVQRGTALSVAALGRPIAGKTGTSNEERSAWFVGYTPDLVVGVYVGRDDNEPMGKGNTGGGLAAPIFTAFMADALKDEPVVDFRVPDGLELFPINSKTGLLASIGSKGTIMEAFKPGTRPPSRTNVIGFEDELSVGEVVVTDEVRKAAKQGVGGLY